MSERLPLSVWLTAQRPAPAQRRGRYVAESLCHPGKMLPDLARRIIETYSSPGDVVVDPMCGIGTTLVEAISLGRDAVGVELEDRWVRVARENVALAKAQGASGNARALQGDGCSFLSVIGDEHLGNVGLVLTSPPYGPSLHGRVATGAETITSWGDHYSKNKANLEYAGISNLLEAMTSILAGCREALRPGGFVAITTRPWRRGGNLIDLPGAVFRCGESVGLEPFERNVALLCGLRDNALVPRSSFFQLDHVRKARAKGDPLLVIAHEDVVVMRKPTTNSSDIAQ